MNKNEILLNKIAQDKIHINEGEKLFNKSNEEEQIILFNTLFFYLLQSHPSQRLINVELREYNFEYKPLKTIKEEFNSFSNKTHRLNIFLAILSIFKKADTERRINFCKGKCNHSWHNL